MRWLSFHKLKSRASKTTTVMTGNCQRLPRKTKKLPKATQRGRGQKQDRAHAEPLTDQNGSDGEGDEKRDRNKRHHANADDRSGFELAHMSHPFRAHGPEKSTAQRHEQIKYNRQENTKRGEAEQPAMRRRRRIVRARRHHESPADN